VAFISCPNFFRYRGEIIMALSYSDVYTVAEYGPRVQEIGKEI